MPPRSSAIPPYAPAHQRRAIGSGVRKIATALLSLFGIQLWLVFGQGYYGTTLEQKLLVIAALIALVVQLVPALSRSVQRAYLRLARPSPRIRFAISVAVAIAMTAFVILIARWQERSFQPQYHDEHSYLI